MWYTHMLADYVTQLRSGHFPVYAGTTAYAFNGAVYPLRVAPLYQHVAGVIDLLTGRTLGFVMLQHLVVVACGVAGIFLSYLTLCRTTPQRRWSAAALSILYLSCPGVLGTIYTQDLYMTWMTVPLAPLVAYGISRTFRCDDLRSQVWLAAPLAGLWWAHAPIAVWFTAIAAFSQGVRLLLSTRSPGTIRKAAFGVGLFAILAQYPFVSVSEIATPNTGQSVVGPLAHPEKLMEFVTTVFPGALKPISAHAQLLSDLQLGYAYFAVLGMLLILTLVFQRADCSVLLASSCILLVLVIPVPWFTATLWRLVPASVVRITYYWPMQRFYIIIAASLGTAAQLRFGLGTPTSKGAKKLFAALLSLGCAWSLWESRQFIGAAHDRISSQDATLSASRLENAPLMDHSYGLFQGLPSYFSNGVMDPSAEIRVFSPGT
ncbi:MAG TPA: hypothetical protein VFE25_04240, partial [Opitutaceae bacterium]|nr:hypothetical protein [Opitutaceae bacterium]